MKDKYFQTTLNKNNNKLAQADYLLMIEKVDETIFLSIEMNFMTWQERNDNVPGWIYLIEARNVTGIIPGRLVRRCKIGLSRNPEMRLDALHSSQPPCDYVILKTIYVENMAEVENRLHDDFKHCSLKLLKSREWFNLNPWQFQLVLWSMSRYEQQYGLNKRHQPVSVGAVVGSLIALLGIGILIGQAMQSSSQTTIQPQAEINERK